MSEFRPLPTRRILIVEDESFTAKLLVEALATQCAEGGHHGCFLVSITAWGEVALQWLEDDSFDAYIIDGNLKGRTHGLDVIERIRKKDETVPIVLHACGAGAMRGSAILHDFHNIEKSSDSTRAAARHIIDSLFAPAP